METTKSSKYESVNWGKRSSVPTSLDSNMLFAFPVPSLYTSAFTDSPLPHYLKHTSSDEDPEDSFCSNNIVKGMIDDFILSEDSPKHQTFNDQSHNVPEFLPLASSFYTVSAQFTPQDIYTHAYEMAKDQLGCRMLQKKLEELNPFSIQTIFDQIEPHLAELMVDPFGNYLIQKLLEVCDEPIFSSTILAVSLSITSISLNPHGTRAVQKLIDLLLNYPQHVPLIVNAMVPDILTLIKDINGNHVIQRCVNSLKSPRNQFIFNIAGENILQIATDRHGCCVLQRCINAATEDQREALVEKIIEKAVDLVQDAFGNYVVQYVIDLNSKKVNAKLAYIFMNSIQQLATQKFSSNVIEKCLQQNSEEIQQAMIAEIGKSENILKMIGDQYANYGIHYVVVQRALSLANTETLDKMLALIKPRLEELKNSHFGKKIYLKLLKNYPVLID
jgi:Pumilio-family RNA binding repeat